MSETDDWTRPGFLADARAWVEARLAERGASITGEIEQPHIRWWSTVLRVPSSDGVVYFKASHPDGAFEGSLTSLLQDEVPAMTAELLAFDAERAWMLTREAGTRLREAAPGREQLEHWERLLPRYAEVQIALAPRAEALVALGVSDLRLESLPRLLGEAATTTEVLTREDEDGMTADERRALLSELGPFAELCRRLSELGIPPSLQHDDLHDGNVFVRDGRHVLFDWGDACVSHPFHTLVVTLRATAYRLGLVAGGPEVLRLRDAYLEPWTGALTRDELVDVADLARRTGTVQRALAWYRACRAMPAHMRDEHGASVPYGLKLYLADAPYGAWE